MRSQSPAASYAHVRAAPGGPTHRGHALAHDIHAVVSAGEELLRTKADLFFTRIARIMAEPPPGRRRKLSDPPTQRLGQAVVLIYELLDAHNDTARLVSELAWDPEWQAHLEYLRALQRKGREVLAQLVIEEGRR